MIRGSILALVLISSIAGAETTFVVNGKPSDKLGAMRALLSNPNAQVLKCNDVMLTEKATLKNKPKGVR